MNNNPLSLSVFLPESQCVRLGEILCHLPVSLSYQTDFSPQALQDTSSETTVVVQASFVKKLGNDTFFLDLLRQRVVLILSDKPLKHQERIHFLQLGVVECFTFDDLANNASEFFDEVSCRSEYYQKAIKADQQKKSHQYLQEAYSLLEEDQHLALAVQQKIQPPTFSIINHFCISYRVCPSQWLSGDFVHYGQVNDNELLVVLGDVSGHGASSAMVVTAVRYLIYRWSNALSKGADKFSLTALLKAVNAELFVMNTDKHVTLLAACINIKTGELSLASAGHLPLAIQKTPEKTEWVSVKGQPLGLFPHVQLNEVQLTLGLQDALIFCSDGALELQEKKGIKAQEQALLSAISSHQVDIADIFKSFDLPVEGGLADDVAVLIVQRVSL